MDQYIQMREEIGRSILEICESGSLGVVVEQAKMIPCLQQYHAEIFQGEQLNMEPIWLFLLLSYPELSSVQLRSAFSPLESDAVIWQLYLRWPVPSQLQKRVEESQRQASARWLKEKLMSSPIGGALAPSALDAMIQKTLAEGFRSGMLDIASLEQPLASAAKTSPSFVRGILVQLTKSPPYPSLRVILGEPVTETGGTTKGSTPGFQKTKDVLIQCLQETRMQDIIDPEKLEMFLDQELESLWDIGAYRLSELWDVFQDAPGVQQDMIEEYFVWLREATKGKSLALEFPAQMSQISNAVAEQRLASVREYNAQLEDVMGGIPDAPPTPPAPSSAAQPTERPAPKPSATQATKTAAASPTTKPSNTPPAPNAAKGPMPKIVSSAPEKPKFPSKEKDPPPAKSKASSKANQALPMRLLLGAGLGGSVLLALVLFLVLLRAPSVNWGGESVSDMNYYKVIIPELLDVRVQGETLLLRASGDFFSQDEIVRAQKIELCFYLAKGTQKELQKVALFAETGRFVYRVEAE